MEIVFGFSDEKIDVILTLLNEQIGESEHHCVSTVEEVSAQEMRVCNGQTST